MRVLFVCSSGMSSAIAVNALQKEGAKNGIDIDVLAVGTQEFEDEVKNGWDIAMVAQQVKTNRHARAAGWFLPDSRLPTPGRKVSGRWNP